MAGGTIGAVGTGITAGFSAAENILPYDEKAKKPNEIAKELWEGSGKTATKGREAGDSLAENLGISDIPVVRDIPGIALGTATLAVTAPAALVRGSAKFAKNVAKGSSKLPGRIVKGLLISDDAR